MGLRERAGVSGGWIKLNNNELCPSLNINGKATLTLWRRNFLLNFSTSCI